ncbi:hypothetical protein [Candidatus Tisiphia endosymbiont of Oplodontha viridula]|uniref:hypothetical protein n=1 Tax=Candidatus Tisiphia endosymbiont of Oplodontha viridula TaxID=3077925 RepID=UPI0035C8E4BB
MNLEKMRVMHLVDTSLSSYEEDGVTLNSPSIAILPRFLANFVTFLHFLAKIVRGITRGVVAMQNGV